MLIFGANVRSPRLQISPATTGRVFSRLHKRLGLTRSRPLSPSSTPTLPLSAFAQGRWSARPFSSPENRGIINARNASSTVPRLAGVWADLGNVSECDADRLERGFDHGPQHIKTNPKQALTGKEGSQ